MNKKRIIDAGKTALSIALSSSMFLTTYSIPLYANTEEVVETSEENNVSDQAQEEVEGVEVQKEAQETINETEQLMNSIPVEEEIVQEPQIVTYAAPDVVFDVGEEYEQVGIKNPSADSEETSGENGVVANAFDGNQSTVWHTLWSRDGQKQMPHWISYELNEPTTIGRIDYVGKPATNGVGNGVFKDVNIYVSEDPNQDPSTNAGWTLVQSYSGITYDPAKGTDTNRSHTFIFAPTLASKVKIEITGSYDSGSGTEAPNMYANALELITYAYKAQPEDTNPISVLINGKSYTGKSIKDIVTDNVISTSSITKLSITSGTIEYSDLEYLGNGSNFLFRNIKELTIDLTKASMLDQAGHETTELPSGIFGTMPSLTKLSLPGVTKIGTNVFKQAGKMSGITSLNLPDVVELSNGAFDNATFNLTNISLPKVQIVGDRAMRGNYKKSTVSLDLPSVVSIGDNAFDNTYSNHRPNIEKLTLPETLQELGHNCFLVKEGGIITLTSQMPPTTPTTSGWYPFGDASFTLKVPNHSYKAEDFGKEGNVTLEVQEVIDIKANVNGTAVSGETLEQAITNAGIQQDDVEVVELVGGIITTADLDYLKDSSVKELTMNLSETLKMEDGSTKIEDNQFQNSSLEKVTLGGFTEIGNSAFEMSTSLATVNMPDVVTIGIKAFYYCDDYVDVILPSSIQNIERDAFVGPNNGGRKLNVTMQSSTPSQEIDAGAFDDGTVTIPAGSLTNYLPKLDLTKTFRSSGDSQWKGLDVIDPSYHLVIFQYGDYGSNRLFAYYEDGAILSSVEIDSFTIPEGMELIGWNTKKDGLGDLYRDDTLIKNNLTLYPVYQETKPVLTVVINDETISGKTLEDAIKEADITTGFINKVEFVSGKVTKDDLEYIAKYADELILKLNDNLDYVGDNDTPTTIFPNTTTSWSQLESLTLEGFTEIASSAFLDVEDLTNVNLVGVEKIQSAAFKLQKNSSTKTMNVTISDSITEIGFDAFNGRTKRPLNLTLDVQDPSTITLHSKAFNGINTSTSRINVPTGSLKKYLPNLDISKTFRNDTKNKWKNMFVYDSTYQLMEFQYSKQYPSNTLYAYVENGKPLNTISFEDEMDTINRSITQEYGDTYIFDCWNTKKDGSGTDINSNTIFPIEANRVYLKAKEKTLVDKTDLNDAITKAQQKVESDYTSDSWNALQDALTKAKEISAKEDATQEEVDQATKLLTDAIEGLKEADKLGPTVKVSYETTQDGVLVTIEADEVIQPIEGWTKVSDTKYTKLYKENTSETLYIKDLTGNQTKIVVTVTGITKPSTDTGTTNQNKEETNKVEGTNTGVFVGTGLFATTATAAAGLFAVLKKRKK